MAGYYTYLISGLPMLHFGAKPPVSSERFFQICHGIISEADIDIIKNAVRIEGHNYKKVQPTAEKWRTFDTVLRNELVKIRAARKRIDPFKFMRGHGQTDPSIAHIALHAHRTPSLMESEEILDKERWQVLDDLSVGHYFDIEFLIIYGIKLLILERWDRINSADSSAELDKALV